MLFQQKWAIISGVGAGLLLSVLFFQIFFTGQISDIDTMQKLEVESASTALPQQKLPTELPFGGRKTSAYRYVALYGSPFSASLGALGEQPVSESINRARQVADSYQPHSTEKVIPTFELITTVASAGPTPNNDYSEELPIEMLKPWVEEAKKAGMYVVLDFQSGRTNFLDQLRQYEELIKEPHVGVALDPEWRLQTPEARHLKTVGSVSAAEINQSSQWLADLVKNNELPQKLFIVHQFKPSMITDRQSLDVSRTEELQYAIHVDGFGTLPAKIDTWNRTRDGLPEVVSLGWKNFYDEDKPTPTPEQTMSLTPKPTFVSFQ